MRQGSHLTSIAIVLMLFTALPLFAQDTVYVSPPTGEKESDRARILAALEEVQPGGTIQFAPGTYMIGEIIHVMVPRITLVGHPKGTTLRGCNPSDFPESPDGLPELFVAVVKCNGLDLAGGYQSVLNLTFEYAWHALILGGMECLEGRGCVPVLEPVESRTGGYLIQGNMFRNSANGVRTIGEWSEPAVIRENQFVNTFHAAVIHGSTVHFLDNNISVPEPEQVPSARHPGEALSLSATDLNSELTLRCTGNVIAGNRIEGHSDGISIALFRPGTSCRENVIQDNIIRVARVRLPTSWAAVSLTDVDSSVVGVPLSLVGSFEAYDDLPSSLGETKQENRLEGNLIKGNHIQGAEGLGIELYRASGNQIVENIIAGIKQRTPYPGLTVNSTNPERAGWGDANGSGIWLSPGSNGNEIADNTFEDIASYAVFIEGDSNRVEVRGLKDNVRDIGSGNHIYLENNKNTIRSTDQCIEETMLPHIEELKIPGASLVLMKDGRIIQEETYGHASLELDVDVTSSTLFPYASIAKIFTGTAILRLVQNGVFSLDNSITELIPNLPGKWSGVTVRHLLSNTSGLPDLNEGRRFENPFIAPKKSWDEILENLTSSQVDFAPGEGYAYNQTNYALLKMLIEQTDGRKIEEYVREEFAEVYGIESLRYGDARDAIPGKATWYTHFDFNSETPQLGQIRPLWIEYPPFLYTGAGLNGTARDLAKFVQAIASGQILDDGYKQEMWSASKLADGTTFRFDNSKTGTGLGWWVHDDPKNPYVEMSGGSSGTARHYIKDSLTVVLLTNLQGSQPEKLVNNLAENCLKPSAGN